MPLLFSYGTLRDAEVQRELFGRTLVGRDDHLLGYELARARVADPEFARRSGSAEHAILCPADGDDARVAGTALEVTAAELAIADAYEPVEYTRVEADLASGGRTWVYVATSGSRGD